MKLPALLLMLMAIGCAPGAQPSQWLADSEKERLPSGGEEVPESSWYEVRTTRVAVAIQELRRVSFIELTMKQAADLAGAHYAIEPGKHAYLFRGLYANLGEHRLTLKNGILIVLHESLGHSSVPQFSPLVVNLPAPPTRVVTVLGVTE
jgi:hypothetical protein